MTNCFACPRPILGASLRLFCFPYAGGGVQAFRAWPPGLPSSVEVRAAQLPGRGARIKDEPFTRLEPLIAALADAMRPLSGTPFALFGHSLGALVCFELARELRRRGSPQPGHLFVSGRAAPHVPEAGPTLHALPEAAFRDELRRLDGTPATILQNEEVMQLLLPALRADFAIAETYAYSAEPPLDVPISAFGGAEDDRVTVSHLEAWREHTRAGFSVHMFPGGHFFIRTAEARLLQTISECLRPMEWATAHEPAP